MNSNKVIIIGQAVYESGSYFHLDDGLQGLGFAWILMQLASSMEFLKEKK